MKKLLLILLSLPLFLSAQKIEKQVTLKLDTSLYVPELSVSYFGEQVMHPGIRVSYEQAFRRVIKDKIRPRLFNKTKAKHKIKTRSHSIGYNFATYMHANNQLALLPSISVLRKTEKNNGFFRAFGIGVGLASNIYLNPTYELDESEELSQVILANRTYLSIPMHIAMGYDFNAKFNFNHKIVVRLGTHLLINYNASTYPLLHAELGYYIPLSFEE